MTGAQRAKFKVLLETLRRELTAKGPLKIEPNRTDAARVGGDEDEQPLNEMTQAIASARNKNSEAVVIRIDKALARLRATPEDFGLCQECDEEILLGRMQAMPYAEYCVKCQAKRDGPKGGPTRKKITDYTT